MLRELPRDMFHADNQRTAHVVLSDRHEGAVRYVSTYCGGTGYRHVMPVYRRTDPERGRYVSSYCQPCEKAWQRENGTKEMPISEDDN